LDRLDPGRMGMAERADRDAADEIEELVAVDVGDLRALGVVDRDAGEQRVTLGPGGQVPVLARAQGGALGPRDRGDEVAVLVRRLRHGAGLLPQRAADTHQPYYSREVSDHRN